MTPLIVTLSPAEWQAAEQIGLRREALRRERGKSQSEWKDNGGTRDERNATGAVAEYALARHFGPLVLKDWCDNKSFSLEHQKIKCDVGKNLHVRATANPRARLLVFHHYDPKDGVFVFAYVDKDKLSVTFYGWMLGCDGIQEENWNDSTPGFNRPGRGAFTVHRARLLPIESIPQEAIL